MINWLNQIIIWFQWFNSHRSFWTLRVQGPLFFIFLTETFEWASTSCLEARGGFDIWNFSYVLIKHLHDIEGWGYRKISKWLNQSGIKTYRGKNWFSSSVIIISVLMRKHERELMNEKIRNKYFPTKISKIALKYYTLS